MQFYDMYFSQSDTRPSSAKNTIELNVFLSKLILKQKKILF